MSNFDLSSTPELQRELDRLGAGRAGSLPEGVLISRLQQESATEFGRSLGVEGTAYELGAEGQAVRSPWRFAVAGPGTELRSLHETPEVIELASEIAGVPMAPSRAYYLYFRDDSDFIGFHTDVPACEVVLLVGISDETADLVLYPHLADSNPADLLELSQDSQGAPDGGQSLPVEKAGVFALVGRRVPHQTPRAPRSQAVTQASLCYAGVGRPL